MLRENFGIQMKMKIYQRVCIWLKFIKYFLDTLEGEQAFLYLTIEQWG